MSTGRNAREGVWGYETTHQGEPPWHDDSSAAPGGAEPSTTRPRKTPCTAASPLHRARASAVARGARPTTAARSPLGGVRRPSGPAPEGPGRTHRGAPARPRPLPAILHT